MSANIVLYTSHALSEKELAEVIIEAGGELTPELPYVGRISAPGQTPGTWAHIWIDTFSCYNNMLDEEGHIVDEGDWNDLQRGRELLEAELASCLFIALSSTAGTQQVAVHFAATFARRWPCVVDNKYGHLFSRQDILRLEQEGEGEGFFSRYGL